MLCHFENSQAGDDLTPLIQQELDRVEGPENGGLLKAITDRVEGKVFEQTRPQRELPMRPIRHTILKPWIRVVAATLVIAFVASYFYLERQKKHETKYHVADIAPGRNQATLTLANGHTIELSGDREGIVIEDSGITYTDGETIQVQGIKNVGNNDQSGLATQDLQLTTPNGGQYHIILPDGSKVWLNAASSLRYPPKFSGNTREVVLNGEGYFEVAKNEKQPFVVRSKGQEVQVVGTAFNINAYDSEIEISTTLVEGVVRISNLAKSVDGQTSQSSKLLRAGQQAILYDGQMQIKEVDVNDYVAWKNGRFVFYGMSLPVVIRQIERWYDVSFEPSDLPSDIELWGSPSRDVMLSEILEAIELNTPLKFKREGRRIAIDKQTN